MPFHRRLIQHLLLAAALILGQYAVNQHALYHLGVDLARAGVATGAHASASDSNLFGAQDPHGPQSDHATDRCLLYFGAGGAPLSCAQATIAAAEASFPDLGQPSLPIPRRPRIEFDSRGPPSLFS